MAKRFYDLVSVNQDKDGFFVQLDGRELKTPGKKPIRVPHDAIAAHMKAEWDAVPSALEGDIDPAQMPVTRLANVVCEAVSDRRETLIEDARNYASTDLLSYRSPEPQDFVKRQKAAWDPWIDWADQRGITLKTTDAIRAIHQDSASLDQVAEYARSLPDFALTLYVHLVAVYGSAILAMAVMEGDMPPEKAFDLSRLDELYRAEIWGTDEEDDATRLALRQETEILGGLASYL